MANAHLLQLINDAQLSTMCYTNVPHEKIVVDLKVSINELITLYNRVTNQSLCIVDYEKIKRNIKAIDRWSGDAFQPDDEVDIALQNIATEIKCPRKNH